MSVEGKKAFTEVTAAVIIREGRVLIAKRRGGDRQAGKWEFPGGKRHSGETPEECLHRELFEELGVWSLIGAPFGTWEHIYDHGAIRLLVYRVPVLRGDIRVLAHEELRWVPPEELSLYDFSEADRPVAMKIARESNRPVRG